MITFGNSSYFIGSRAGFVEPRTETTSLSLIHPEVKYDFDFVNGQYFGALPSDLVVSRASDALTLTPGGIYTNFAADTARITGNGLMVEEARTNLLLNSSTFETSWVAGASGDAARTAAAGVSPSGANDAVLLSDSDAANTTGRRQSLVITSSSNAYTASVFLKAGTSSVASVRLSLGGGTALNAEGVIDLTNGNTQWRTANVGTTLSSLAIGNGWYRISLTITDNSTGNTSLIMEVRPAFATTYSPTLDVAATGTVLAWGANISQTTFSLSPIISGASATPRPADVVYLPISGIGTEYTVYAETDSLPVTGTSRAIWQMSSSGSVEDNSARLTRSNDNTNFDARIVSAATGRNLGALVAAASAKTALRVQGGSSRICAGGALGTVDTGAAPVAAPIRIQIGSIVTGAGFLNNNIKRIAIIPRALSDAELQAITT